MYSGGSNNLNYSKIFQYFRNSEIVTLVSRPLFEYYTFCTIIPRTNRPLKFPNPFYFIREISLHNCIADSSHETRAKQFRCGFNAPRLDTRTSWK